MSFKKGCLEVLVSKKHGTLENTRLLQVTSLNNDGATQMYGYKCSFNTIQDGDFRGCSQMGGRDPKRSTSIKSVIHIIQWWNFAQLYPTWRRSKNNMNRVTHSLSSADISIFSSEISNFCYSKKYRYRLHFNT